MEKTPIGMNIKKLVKKNNLSVQILADKLGISRQAVYNTYHRSDMHEGELKRWSKAMNVTIDELTNESFNSELTNKSSDNGTFGNEVLQNIQKLLEEEIREKNDQIRALQEALKESQKMASALLGKSHEYSPQSIAQWSSIPYKGVRG